MDGAAVDGNGSGTAIAGKAVTAANAAGIAICSRLGQCDVGLIFNPDCGRAANTLRAVATADGVCGYIAAADDNGCTAAGIGRAVAAADTITVSTVGHYRAAGDCDCTVTAC